MGRGVKLKAWIHHHRKMVATIVALIFILILILRAFVFYEIDPAGNPDTTATFRSFFDGLLATILVTASVTVALTWFRSPIEENINELFIQPFEIDDTLRKGALDTREWYYLGHTAKYIRSQILPSINRESLAKNENKKIKIIILNPNDAELCSYYAKYRKHSRSSQINNGDWTEKSVKLDLIASILCMIELHQANSMLEVNAGLKSHVSLFRVDISSSMALVTQEDNQESAIRYTSDSQFYRCYRREMEIAWDQCEQLKINSVSTHLDMESSDSIRSCLNEVGFDSARYSDSDLLESGVHSLEKRSPYVSR